MIWYYEALYPDVQQAFRVDEVLYEGRSEFQKIKAVRCERLGRVLLLDDVVQTTEADEFIYHEMMTHVPLTAHGSARRVLIVGGGDGGILREVLRHPVERAVMVEIDGEVIRVSREFLPSLSAGAFEDPRAEVIVGDGAAFMAGTDEVFDVIIVDSTDPIGPGEVLFREAFYRNCMRCLADDGVLVTQNGVPFLQLPEFVDTAQARARLFDHSGFYFAAVPTYYGGQMAFGWASRTRDIKSLGRDEAARRIAASGVTGRWHNADIHAAAFAMPTYLRDALTKVGVAAG